MGGNSNEFSTPLSIIGMQKEMEVLYPGESSEKWSDLKKKVMLFRPKIEGFRKLFTKYNHDIMSRFQDTGDSDGTSILF
jgi:hypothetical protein